MAIFKNRKVIFFDTMKLTVIDCGNMMVDGGALFGVIPKTMWEKRYSADERNLCNIKMRSLLVEVQDKVILIDTGTGDKQSPDFFKYDYLNGDGSLMGSLAKAGFKAGDITDVVHTHLHFDHCGGTLKYDENKNIVPAFPNAVLWVSRQQWDWAIKPNRREAPAYPPENILHMPDSGKLRFIESEGELYPGFSVLFAQGHTRGQVIPVISNNGHKIIYGADLIPTMANVPLSFISAYDLFQLDVLSEKEQILNDAFNGGNYLFFEHDLNNECCTLKKEKNQVVPDRIFKLEEIKKKFE
jgi:glyoxylase-like metal-dependent hydrolase (beta-lactamase superfamily II)